MDRRHLYLWAIAFWTAVILLAVVPWRGFDPGGHWHRIRWIPFVSRPVGLFDIVGNLVLFVPLGASIALHAGRSAVRRTVAVAFALSLFGEWSQIYSRYRYPTTQDILLNVIGAVIAAYVVEYLRRWYRQAETLRTGQASEAPGPKVKVMYGSRVPPTLINGRGKARVD